MRTLFTAVVVGFLAAGCASNASTPSQGERQALAPTGKLRVALYTGAPASIVQGATLDESKGVGFDLGKELARRIGVPFEPVVYPSPGAIMVGLKSGEWDLAFFGPTPERDSVLNFTEPLLVIEHGYLVPAGEEMLKSGKVDAFAANKANLYGLSDKMPGSRVLDGRIGVDEVAIALPKGRESGMAYVRKYAEDVKAEGLVKAAIQRAGLRGAADK